MKHTSTHYFPKILAAPSLESCVEPSTLKNEPTMKKEFNVSTIFSYSRKRYSTFHNVLQEKQIIIPARHSENISSSFAHVISSDEESNVLSIPSTSEPKYPCISHVSLLK